MTVNQSLSAQNRGWMHNGICLSCGRRSECKPSDDCLETGHSKSYDTILSRNEKARKEHPEWNMNAWNRYYARFPEKRLQKWRSHHDRRRGLKVDVLLNEFFEDSHLHHMQFEFAAFIPSVLHNSVRHSLSLKKNMNEIDWKALEFVLK